MTLRLAVHSSTSCKEASGRGHEKFSRSTWSAGEISDVDRKVSSLPFWDSGRDLFPKRFKRFRLTGYEPCSTERMYYAGPALSDPEQEHARFFRFKQTPSKTPVPQLLKTPGASSASYSVPRLENSLLVSLPSDIRSDPLPLFSFTCKSAVSFFR